MKRISGAKVVGEQMSLDMESETNVEEVGGGSKRKKGIESGSGSKSCRRSARIRIACDLKKFGGAKQINLDMKSERNKQGSRRSKSRNGNRSRWPRNCLITSWVSPEPSAREKLFRMRGETIVGLFNHDFAYGAVKSSAEGEASGGYDRTTLIWSGGYKSFAVPSSGITWVAVNGGNSISVVTKKDQHVDKARLGDFLRNQQTENVLLRFIRTIVHLMEDPSSELRKRFEQGVEIRSFAAVSMALGSDGVHEEIFHEGSIARSGEGEAINFLKEKVEKDLAFTYKDTVQTAISALQRLHQENFKATDILVGVWKKGEPSDSYLTTRQIKNHLEVIHKKAIVGWSSGV